MIVLHIKKRPNYIRQTNRPPCGDHSGGSVEYTLTLNRERYRRDLKPSRILIIKYNEQIVNYLTKKYFFIYTIIFKYQLHKLHTMAYSLTIQQNI